MSLSISLTLIGELLPLSISSEDEDLIELIYDRIIDLSDDECLCAILNLLSKARLSLYDVSNGKVQEIQNYSKKIFFISVNRVHQTDEKDLF